MRLFCNTLLIFGLYTIIWNVYGQSNKGILSATRHIELGDSLKREGLLDRAIWHYKQSIEISDRRKHVDTLVRSLDKLTTAYLNNFDLDMYQLEGLLKIEV